MQYDERDWPSVEIEEPLRPSRERIDLEALQRLADDVAANGLHQRIGVKLIPDTPRVRVVYGHRRFLAMKLLNWPAMPVKVYAADADELQIRMAENEMRADLNPIEQAKLCREFVERGDPITATARYFRRSPGWVSERLALLDLPDDVQEAISDGVLSVAVAHELARVDHDVYRVQLIAEAANHGCSERTAAAWAAHFLADRARLVANAITIQEMAARRQEYKITASCECCQQDVELADSVSLRLCRGCQVQIARALATPAE